MARDPHPETGRRAFISFVATARPAEALAFYRDLLGLDLVEDTPFALVFSEDGHMLRVQKVERHTPAAHTVLGWKVGDIRREVAALAAKGVTFSVFAGLDQDGDGIWTTPDGHRVAWFRDPDGNQLSLAEFAGS